MNLDYLLQQTIDVAKRAGAFIRTEKKTFKQSKVEVKGKNDFVSYVDKQAEIIIIQGLQHLLPEAGFITEEKQIDKKSDTLNWIIDPLDGTTNFVHGVPLFAVSIALMDKGQVVVGVIYEINLDECFAARLGGGAFCNGEPIYVSTQQKLADSLLVTGFPYYNYDRLPQYLQLFNHLMQHSRGIRRLGSAATDLAYVAAGRFESFYEYGLNPWDVAAGVLLVNEAGGCVTDFENGSNVVFGKDILATNKIIHQEFQEVINQFMK